MESRPLAPHERKIIAKRLKLMDDARQLLQERTHDLGEAMTLILGEDPNWTIDPQTMCIVPTPPPTPQEPAAPATPPEGDQNG